jgi:Txe/YoeB family toxin of Txe-Axe toxin-antitoxin module
MDIEYTLQAKEDIDYLKKSGKASILKSIRKLIEVILRSPYECIDKPEALKYKLTGC